MAPVGERLSVVLGRPVKVMRDCIGLEVRATVEGLAKGEVMLLENLRFHSGETKNDPTFARELRTGDGIGQRNAPKGRDQSRQCGRRQAHGNRLPYVATPETVPQGLGRVLQCDMDHGKQDGHKGEQAQRQTHQREFRRIPRRSPQNHIDEHQRQKRLKLAAHHYRHQAEEIARIEDFIRRNMAGQKTKQAQSKQKYLARLKKLEKPRQETERPTFQILEGGRSFRQVVKVDDLTIGYGNIPLVNSISFEQTNCLFGVTS